MSSNLAEVNEKLKEIREDVQQLTEIKGETQQKEIFKVTSLAQYVMHSSSNAVETFGLLTTRC